MHTLIETFRDTLQAAGRNATPVSIRGAGTKAFYGRGAAGEPFPVGDYTGVLEYAPTELVITARSGTPLNEIEAVLAAQGQMLGFEPPHFGAGATLGGTIACGLSGPRRPWAGAARDFVLGITCLNGRGDYLRFGGQVMKNVAGYDVARTLTGSLGTLAVLLDISLRVLPRPEHEITLVQDAAPEAAVRRMNRWSGKPLPLSAACYHAGRLAVRLSGMERGVQAAARDIGGERLQPAAEFWESVREHTHPFLAGPEPLWRASVPPATAPLLPDVPGLVDWGGAQRWFRTVPDGAQLQARVAAAGGHLSRFRGGDRERVFQPLPPALLALHRRLKDSFDPAGILNPGRMYAEL